MLINETPGFTTRFLLLGIYRSKASNSIRSTWMIKFISRGMTNFYLRLQKKYKSRNNFFNLSSYRLQLRLSAHIFLHFSSIFAYPDRRSNDRPIVRGCVLRRRTTSRPPVSMVINSGDRMTTQWAEKRAAGPVARNHRDIARLLRTGPSRRAREGSISPPVGGWR